MRTILNFFPQSIRLNLCFIVLATIAPIMAVIFFSGLERRNHEIESSRLDALRLVNSFANQQENMVLSVRQLLSALALLPDIQNHDLEACSRTFEKLLQLNPDYGNITLLNPEGDVVASGLPLVKANFGNQKHVMDAIKNREFSAGEYIIGRISAIPIIAFAWPVLDSHGRLTGVLTASLKLDQFTQQFQKASLPQGSIFSMLDYKGIRLCYYPPNEKTPVGKPIPPASWSEYSMTAPEGLSLHTGADGVSRYYAFRQLKLKPETLPYMIIVAAIPEKLAYEKADAITREYLIWLAGAALLSILAAWTIGHYGIIRRLQALGELAARIGKGELETRTGLIETKTSLGMLAKAFDNMASTLEAREAERKTAEEALHKSEEMFRRTFDEAPIGAAMLSLDFKFLRVNETLCLITGYSAEELLSLGLADISHPKDLAVDMTQAHRLSAGQIGSYNLEERYIRKDGNIIWVNLSMRLIKSETGFPLFYLPMIEDTTKRRQMEEALRKSEERYQKAQKIGHTGNWEYDLKTNHFWGSDEAKRIYGFDPEKSNFSTDEIENCIPERERVHQALIDLIQEGKEYNLEFEIHPINSTEPKIIWSIAEVQRDDNGDPLVITGLVQDITERKRAEKELREKTAIAQTFMDALPCVALLLKTKTREIVALNKTALDSEARLGATCFKSWPKFDKPCSFCRAPIAWETGKPQMFEVESIGRFWEAHWVPVTEDLFFHYALDITERKQAEQEKEKLQAQLQQAQKMESIGTLAGGIAHDFNNLLQAINGYTQMLLIDKNETDPEYPSLQAILQAGNRAAELVRDLLLFSRKVDTERKPVELNREIENACRMLERTIPKMIEIELHPGRSLWPIKADPVQMEQILLNLGKNAADAMPDGGKLIIESENITLDEVYAQTNLEAKPGQYVLLTISDTGHGMDKETVGKIFEPFFTTKEIGKGTGLGLASVYGIVKGHRGHIDCYSEVGRGTTFRIYLPAIMPVDIDEEKVSKAKLPRGGTETILLVDDEEPIRGFASHLLKKFGYTVLTASSGEEALKIYAGGPKEIDLVIMDIGMPGMGGLKCLGEIVRIDPAAKVLVASGYAVNGQIKKTVEAGAVGYVGKPYKLTDLLDKVRVVLDGKD
ncbi:MAG: PAS domain S-box protein [Deltaproteobacteria bacterium]|nr:PAS domain S-box protein [Deltaproteobacteria bacterium]